MKNNKGQALIEFVIILPIFLLILLYVEEKKKTKAGITGVEIAARIIRECKPYCQGVHIMALGWEAKVPEILKLAGI